MIVGVYGPIEYAITMFNSQSKKLLAGQAAPKFSALDVLGKQVHSTHADARYILLVFMRYSGCPWCNLAIHRLTLEYPILKENGCEVITFIQSPAQGVIDNIYNRHAKKPQFSIVADPDSKYYKLYGVMPSYTATVKSLRRVPFWVHSVKDHGYKQPKVDGNLFMVPASFLISARTNKILKTSYGTDYYDKDAFMDIYESVFFKEL